MNNGHLDIDQLYLVKKMSQAKVFEITQLKSQLMAKEGEFCEGGVNDCTMEKDVK